MGEQWGFVWLFRIVTNLDVFNGVKVKPLWTDGAGRENWTSVDPAVAAAGSRPLARRLHHQHPQHLHQVHFSNSPVLTDNSLVNLCLQLHLRFPLRSRAINLHMNEYLIFTSCYGMIWFDSLTRFIQVSNDQAKTNADACNTMLVDSRFFQFLKERDSATHLSAEFWQKSQNHRQVFPSVVVWLVGENPAQRDPAVQLQQKCVRKTYLSLKLKSKHCSSTNI